MNIPKNAIKIINKLNEASFEAYFVGGCVRDMIMGKIPKDWDITTSAKPQEVKKLFPKTFDTGIKHGTITVLTDKQSYEVTTYRIDGEYKDCRRPEEIIFTASLKEDLLRRDFTMNAIAFHPKEGYVDYYEGISHIESKMIKGVGNADLRFKEDALRMLRAIRFSSQLDFDIEEETFKALKENCSLISNISMERIRDELIKTFTSEYTEKCKYFLNCNILYKALYFIEDYLRFNLFDFLLDLNSMEKSKRSHVSVFSLLLKNMDRDSVNSVLREMKLDRASIKSIANISSMTDVTIKETPYDIKRIISEIGTDDFFILLSVKNALGENTEPLYKIAQNSLKKNEPIFIRDLKINGDIIMKELGIKGKTIGEVLMYLHKQILENSDLNQEEILLEMARHFIFYTDPS